MLNSRNQDLAVTPKTPKTKSDNGLINKIHYPCNGSTFSDPKITSTPLSSPRKESIFATPPKARLLTPRRYLLSEIATPPRSIRKEQKKLNTIYKNSGPLLASLGYNESVSVYEETKSPGLAGRIVQYNEEVERKRLPTHQKKYGSPGLFPVVHLFKKNLPNLEQKPKRVTIQIGHSDYTKHSPDYNRKLLEGIVRPNISSYDAEKANSEPNTRSVLDALKEISRKRIHTSEDYDANNDNGKRQRTEQFINALSNNKRLRDDSPVLSTVSSPSKPDQKRTCVYDEYAASCSSTKLDKKEIQPTKRKTASLGTLTENTKDIKQVKLINAETQTFEEIAKTPVIDVDNVEQSLEQKSVSTVKESPIKVFDDAPLERIRKSRLVTLMGQLVGKEAALTSYPEKVPISQNKSVETQLTSILSNENSPKPNKHVHFEMPSEIPLSTSVVSITHTSTSVATPIVSAVISKSSGDFVDTLVAPPTSPVSSVVSNVQNFTNVPSFSFGTANSAVSSSPTVINPISESYVNSSAVPSSSSTQLTNTLMFKSPQSNKNVAVSTVSNLTETPKKVGGFKFDLNKSVSTTSISSTVMPSNFSSSTIANTGVTSPFTVKPLPTVSSTVGTSTTQAVSSPTFSFTSPAAPPKPHTFTFVTKPSNNINPSTAAFTMISTPSVATFASASFSTSTPSVNFAPKAFDTKNPTGLPSVISFGNSINTVKAKTTNEGFSFKSPTTTPSVFETNSKPSSGLESSHTVFGASSTAPTFSQNTLAFGQTKPQNLVVTTSSTFGSSNIFNTAVTNASGSFTTSATPVATNIFGAVTTQSAPFGSSTNPTFGNAVSAPFGTNTTSVTTAPFGSSSSASVFSFGAKQPMNNGFGSGSTGFGAPTTTSTSSIFGAPQTFGSSSSVATTTANSAFGTGQTFGSSAVTTTTASSVFGAAQTFGGAATSGFGSNNAFGSNSSAFGSPAVPSFNQNQLAVGNNNANNSFGAAAAFGTTTDKPAFNFSAGSATSAFVKPQPVQNVGPSSTTAFGTPAAPNTFSNPASQTGTFNFGSAAATPKPAVFAFGGGSSSTVETPKVGFNFGSNSTSTPFGGGNPPPTFGSPAGPTFGAVPQTAPQFNAGGGTTAGVFNIGAGSTSSRHRTQLKAKRRT